MKTFKQVPDAVRSEVYAAGSRLIDAVRRDWPSSPQHRKQVLDAANDFEQALRKGPAQAEQNLR